MTATIIPFPLVRRRKMVARNSRYAVSLSQESARRHIDRLAETQRNIMRSRGIDHDVIEAEIGAFSTFMAIRISEHLNAGGAA